MAYALSFGLSQPSDFSESRLSGTGVPGCLLQLPLGEIRRAVCALELYVDICRLPSAPVIYARVNYI